MVALAEYTRFLVRSDEPPPFVSSGPPILEFPDVTFSDEPPPSGLPGPKSLDATFRNSGG